MEKKGKQDGKEYVLKMAREHNVKFVELWFTDILGNLKSYAIPVSELEGAIDNGLGFDGSSVEGYARIDESDMMSVPDLDTFQLLALESHERMCPWPGCSAISASRAERPSKAIPDRC